MAASIPVVDISPLRAGGEGGGAAASAAAGEAIAALDAACRAHGFFYVAGHGVSPELIAELDRLARAFFAEDEATKLQIRMALGGRAWRGYFPVGGELTSGVPDWKEGLYFGAELAEDHPDVRRGLPLHGQNLFPPLPGFRDAVLAYMHACEQLGHTLMAALAQALGRDPAAFRARYLARPITLFRIFHYPPQPPAAAWGVGEHTDYGLLTMLVQDDRGGLEIRTRDGWIDAPPIEGTFVCNLGDMLESISGGRYRSTPHRAKNRAATGRLSMPFFFDPSWDAAIEADEAAASRHVYERWDGRSVHAFEGRYGDYLLGKVGKVFPGLRTEVLAGP
ncbi:MAG TPA: 2-oxoglutarate and iron-dependent oxygenase domain-containing protein [Kofleriaceae bacterium]|nr:2-oxoglutarate and iron-dependent oxygenase domain-containing protein [Kofleriaceae bacterium]